MRGLFTILSLFLLIYTVEAQQKETLLHYNEYKFSDSLLVIPSSIVVTNASRDTIDFDYDAKLNYLLIHSEITSSSIPFTLYFKALSRKARLVDSPFEKALYDSNAVFKDKAMVGTKKHESARSATDLIGLSGLNIEGAFLRSVSGGAQQSARMHSVMDLKLSGALSPILNLNARITDQQMPFQPEGNTQRLQDFDRIMIELSHQDWNLSAGDLMMQSEFEHPFFAINRNIQGVAVSSDVLGFDSTKANTRAIGALSRSKWTSQTIQPIEGVSGPYRLSSPSNNAFIFIIAGSEKVYLDGELLERGLTKDYTIDYNAAELEFTHRHYINKYSRVVVEFEYSDEQYNRTVNYIEHQQQIDRLEIDLSFYNEKDNPYSNIHDLSAEDYNTLSALDAHSTETYVGGVDSLNLDGVQNLYARKDTTINNKSYSYYQLSEDKNERRYAVTFSLVNRGEGNYIQANQGANERVYEWIPPFEGVSQGNYRLGKKIVLPQQKRYVNIGLKYQFKNKDELSFQYSTSSLKNNLFSREPADHGNALDLSFSSEIPVKKMLWRYTLTYQYLDSAYNPIQAIREADFNRNWGYSNNSLYTLGEEQIVSFNSRFSGKYSSISSNSSIRVKENLGEGIQNSLSYTFAKKGLQLEGSVFNVRSGNDSITHRWDKVNALIGYTKWNLNSSYRYSNERHASSKGDSIQSSFNAFDQHQFALRNVDSLNLQFQISHSFRNDYRPRLEEFVLLEHAQNTQLQSSYSYGTGDQVSLNINRRAIRNTENAQHDEFYQGGLDWRQSLFDGAIAQELHYQTGTGRVLERNYIFQQVANGLGTHSWTDLNENGKQERNEFYEDNTSYGDRNFVKIFLIGTDYITAYTNSFNYSVNARFPKLTNRRNTFLYYLQSLHFNYNITRQLKSTFEKTVKKLNPFQRDLQDANILQNRQFNQFSAFFNRGGKVQLTFRHQNHYRKLLLSEGFESRSTEENGFVLTYNPLPQLSFLLNTKKSTFFNSSEVVQNRDYVISSSQVGPELQYFISSNWKVQLNHTFISSADKNQENATAKVFTNKTEFRSKYVDLANNILEFSIGHVSVESGLETNNSPMAIEMFEGLTVGKNYVWNFIWRRKIFKDLNLSLNYSGRKLPSQNKAIHRGNVQLSALF